MAKPPKPEAETDRREEPADEPRTVDDKRRSRDYSQRAFDLVREATERHEDDAPEP